MTNYNGLDTMIRAAIKGHSKIAICPFAEEGMRAKQILNWRYGIQETYIIDNRLEELNPNIISVESLKTRDVENLVVLLTISNKEINQTLENEIRDLGLGIAIQNCLKPAWMLSPEKEEYLATIKKLMTAKEAAGKKFIRVGKDYAGGYAMIDDFNPNMRVYSFGICDDVSFDKQLANKGMDIYMYDHTISGLPEQHEKFHFKKIGISHIDEPENHKLSMKTILKANGDEDNHNLILKMDVEGAEWNFINSTSSEVLNQFVQITFEFHRITELSNTEQVLSALKKMNQTHQLVWVHANNYGYTDKAGEYEIPAYPEVTYLNKNHYSFKDSECYFPLADIDMPDDLSIEEVILGNWGK